MSNHPLMTNSSGKFSHLLAACLLIVVSLSLLDHFPKRAIAGYSSLLTGNPRQQFEASAFCDDVLEIPLHECQALEALYVSTNGTEWVEDTGWMSSLTPCSWYGVDCSAEHIISVQLPENGLFGSLPTELGNLDHLTLLYLNNNQLTGVIPAELGNLNNLSHLVLYKNQLTGSIPAGLESLNNLSYLNLGGNQLSGPIPPELGNLSNLFFLYLNENQLTGSIPIELTYLSNLSALHLSRNQISGTIPAGLGDINSLSSLNLDWNQLTGFIPEELSNLPNLSYLNLSWNQLTGTIPPQLGNLSNLYYLSLSGNQLNGPIPIELANLNNLNRLHLSNNNLSGSIPTEIGNLSNLVVLDLDANQFTGSIPAELGNLHALITLSGRGNQFSGPIPSELANLNNLVYLALSYNQLSGTVPVGFGNLGNLSRIELAYNQLTGSLPPQLGQLSNLTLLSIGNNQLTGSIPVELGNLVNLSHLFLDDNRLGGPIPASLGDLSSLSSLRLNNNQLSGVIPETITNLVNLSELYIGYNALSTMDPAVAAFLNEISPDWADTQTVSPGNLQGNATSTTEVTLTWTPIPYTAGSGYYEVSSAINEAGPYSVAGITTDKASGSMYITGLTSGQTYYFRMRTFTAAGWLDPSELWSEYSPSVPVSMPENPQAPVASFTATPLSGPAPLMVSFTNTSSGAFSSSSWDFGDGSTSSVASPNYTYYLAGSYTVSLTVSEAQGSSTETKTGYINVTALAQKEITPEAGGEISFDPPDGGTVSVNVPGGAVAETITLQLTENQATSLPPDLSLVGISFNLTALQNGLPLDGYEFLAPILLQIDYSDDQVQGLDEAGLRLYLWDDNASEWLDASQTCIPASEYSRNPGENWFSVEICHLTQFAVLGQSKTEGYSIFLPALGK
jgi:Leucine-rich repeat (LRR) protein